MTLPRLRMFLIALTVAAAFFAATGGVSYAAVCVSSPAASGAETDHDDVGNGRYAAMGQAFTVSSNCYVTDLLPDLNPYESSGTTYSAEVDADSSGVPSGTALFATTAQNPSSWSSGFSYVDFPVSGSPELVPSTTYWLVLKYTQPSTGSQFVLWGTSNVGVTTEYYYTNNSPITSGWTNAGAGETAIFEIEGTSSGGGGSTTTVVEATSSPDQIQTDWLGAFMLFFGSMVFGVWLVRTR